MRRPPPEISSELRQSLGLGWLIRLRWIAVAGQIVICLIAWRLLGFTLPLPFLFFCIGLTALSNVFVTVSPARFGLPPRVLCGILVTLDMLILTAMLYACGGAHNPFTAFYLLHVTIAAILLSPLWTWASMFLAAVCYSFLFLSPFNLTSMTDDCCGGFSLHIHGMLLAMILSGACIAFFVSRLRRDLDTQDVELARAHLAAERHERFASLATLAAGMAHELATPLGTIAIASKELERTPCPSCAAEIASDDARLIRAEVERCRLILEKLADRSADGSLEVPGRIRLASIPLLLEDYLKFEHRSRVSYQIEDEDREVVVPEVPLLQALAIVVKNGLEASRDDQSVDLLVHGDAIGVTFSIRDQGEGMSTDIARRVGEPFFTTKEPGEGVGLGLFLVRTFVERVKGRFTVHSRPAAGTTLDIFIPWTSPSPVA